MAVRSVFRRFFKICLITIGVFALAIFGLHILFVNNARSVLQHIVAEKSHGKLTLSLSKLSFDFFAKELQISGADLESLDSLIQPATYHVTFHKLTLKIHSFWPLLLQKRLLLDSIKLDDPVISVKQWRQDTTSQWARDDLSIPKELGKLYNSMLDVLDAFGIKRILIDNASVSLVNKMKPESEPVTITKINLSVFRHADKSVKRDEYIPNVQSVGLRTRNQNIALPGGRHHISFKAFTLQLFRRYITLDSCTITAISTGEAKSSYKIFFSKLLLIGVDVNAMYRGNVIKADSVYCENPLFTINLIASDSASKKKGMPDFEKIIRDLTGNLDLAFVGVRDAGININMSGSRERSLLNSNKDNFIMRGLRINADSATPVKVEQFDMLVRDYRLYNEDSSTAYSFDSVTFKNNKIALNNFTVTTTSGRHVQRNERHYTIPYFELAGLDWYRLIFDETLKAREAVLYNPVINYTRNAKRTQKKMNLFASLHTIDDLVTLDKVNIVHGQINIKLGPSRSFNFKDVNLSLYSDKLLKSTSRQGLRRAIDYFTFSNGFLKLDDITAHLQNIRYTGSNLIHADKLAISSKSGRVAAVVNDLYIDNMYADDSIESIVVEGLRWRDATVELQSQPRSQEGNKGSIDLELQNIEGNNTKFRISNGKTEVSSFLHALKIASLSKKDDAPIQAHGFSASGSEMAIKTNPLQLKTGPYKISGDSPSSISALEVESFEHGDSLSFKSPRVNFSTNINQILSGNLHLSNLEVKSPDINFKKWNTAAITKNETGKKLSLKIDRILITEPDIHIATHRNDSVTIVNIPRSGKSNIEASAFSVDNGTMKLESLSFNTGTLTVLKAGGNAIGVEKGSIDLELSDLEYSKKEGKPFWTAVIKSLDVKNPTTMGLGKNKNQLSLREIVLGNFQLSSDHLDDFRKVLRSNVSAWVRGATGFYIDSKATLRWYNAGYDNTNKTFSLDSFSYHPTQPLDSALAKASHQFDYITFRSGSIKLKDFDLQKYKSDSSIIADTVEITDPVVTIFRDKLPPFLAGIIKPLPVDYIEKIKVPISVKRVNIRNGNLSYTEKNAKTRAEARVFFTGINGGLTNIKNNNISNNDSLGLSLNAQFMDSALIYLRVKESYTDTLSGFLMSIRMRPTSLTFLNPVLIPMSNITIVSGAIDSLHLRAIGRENLALGEMNMFYHNLRIKLLKPGEADQTTFKTRLVSMIANTFVVKTNNKGRTGLVYFERLRDRSFFNYIVKMTFSGLATSVGIKKNKKYMKRYKQELRDRNLPPIDFQF